MALDVLLWAHSDQQGGTEMPCVFAEAMLRAALDESRQRHIGLITPYPHYVEQFFPDLAVECFEGKKQLELVKYDDGSVNADGTADLLAQRFKNLDIVWGAAADIVQRKIDENTLIISCGEPVALKVAKECGCRGIIVTDHLLTVSVRHVLEDGGLLDERTAPIMTMFENWDRLASGAYLSPLEFASPEYSDYLSLGGLPATPISGLFYEPIRADDLQRNTAYSQVIKESEGAKVVFIFGGGGTVWDSIVVDADKRASCDEKRDFALINRCVRNEKPVKGEWTLHKPSGLGQVPIEDPGRLMYWFPCCELVVGRGGLLAQQVAATMISDIKRSPEMLFIEEPGHPQIESERRELARLGLVLTRKLRGFRSDPFGVITEAMTRRDPRRRLLAKARYSSDALRTLSSAIWSAYF